MSSAEARYLRINFDEVMARLKEYAKSKAELHKTKTIVLVGSFAKGTYTGCSDADVIVIAENLPKNVLERYAMFAEPTMPIDLEPRVYTQREFVSMVERGERFALDSLATGIPLYGEKFFRDLKEAADKMSEAPRGWSKNNVKA